jgi:drug/metabolite transporter (DMT)-like permease
MSTHPATPAPRGSAVLLGTACLLFAAVSWGMNVPLTAVLFRTFDPFFLSPLRVAIASLALGAMMLATLGARSFGLPTSAGKLATTSLAMAAFFVLYNVGLRYTDTITAAAITAGNPVYAAITLRLLTRAPLERGFWGAAAMTLVGAGIAIWGRAGDSATGLTLQGGEPLLVLSLVSWTLYSILAQRWFDPSVLQLRRTFAATLGTVAWLTVFWGLLRAAGLVGPPPSSPGAEAITYLMITAVFATALGGFAWNIGVNRMGVAASSLWQNTVPVFAVLISMLFGMVPTLEQVVGGTIVLAGVLYMQWHKVRALRG